MRGRGQSWVGEVGAKWREAAVLFLDEAPAACLPAYLGTKQSALSVSRRRLRIARGRRSLGTALAVGGAGVG